MANYNDYAAYDNEDEEEGSYGLNDSVLSQMQGYQFPNQGTPGREYDILNQAKQFSDNYEKKYYKDAITGQEKNAEHRYLNDFFNAVGERTLQLPGVIAGMADIPAGIVGFDRPFGKMADAVGEATGYTKWAKEAPVYSPGLQKDKQEIEKAWEQYDAGEASTLDLVGKYLQNPTVVTDIGAKTIPDLMLMGGLGAVPRVGAAAAEGAVMAGSAMDSMGESVEDPRLRAATAAGIGLLGAGVTKASKALADKAGVIDPDTLVTRGYAATRKEAEAMLNNSRGIGTRLAIGGGIEAGEELAQSTEETILQNLAEGKPWDENLRRNQVEGAIGGGLLGSIMNAPGPIRGQALPGQEDTLRDTPDEPSGNVGSETPSDGPVLDPNAGPMQRAASKSAEVANKVEGLPNLPGDEVLNFRDGSTATRAEMEAYLTEQGMSPEQIDAYIRSRAEGDQISGEAPGIDSFINADDAIRTQQQNNIKNFANLSRITGDQEGFGLGLQPTAQQEIAAEEPQLDLIFNRAAQALTSLENIVAANPELSEDIYGQGGWADELEYYKEAIAKSDGDVQAAHINDLTITLDALDRAFESNTVVANEQTKTQSQEAPTGAQQTETTQQVTNDQQNTQQQPADAVAADEQELADRQSDAVPTDQTLPDVAQQEVATGTTEPTSDTVVPNTQPTATETDTVVSTADQTPTTQQVAEQPQETEASKKEQIANLRKRATELRKEAAAYNKEKGGFATKNKGKNLFGTGAPRYIAASNPAQENKISAEHTRLLSEAKRLAEEANKIEATLPKKAKKAKIPLVNYKIHTTAPSFGMTRNDGNVSTYDISNINAASLDLLGYKRVYFKPGPVQEVYAETKDGVAEHLFDGDTKDVKSFLNEKIKQAWKSRTNENTQPVAKAGKTTETNAVEQVSTSTPGATQNALPTQNNYLAEKGFTEAEIAELENARKTTKNLNSYARGRFQERAVGVDFEKGWDTNENTQPVTPQNAQGDSQAQQQTDTLGNNTEQQGGLANVAKTPEKAVEQPWTDNKEDTDRWFGSRVEIAPQYKNESAEYGEVRQVLKGMSGPIIEVKIDGTDSTFRYRPDQLKVVSIVDNGQVIAQEQVAPAEEKASQKKGKAPNKKNPVELLTRIRNLGGVNRDELIANGIETKTAKGTNALDSRLANKNGRKLDDLAQKLQEEGYLPQDRPYDPNELFDLIVQSFNKQGETYSLNDDSNAEAIVNKLEKDRREYDEAQQEDLLSSYSKEDIEAKQQRIKDANAKEAAEKKARDQKYDSDQSLNTVVDEMLGKGVTADLPGAELNVIRKAQDNTTEAETTGNEKLSEQELGDLFDNIFAEETSKRQPKQTQPQEVETKQGQPQKTRTATESAKSAAANTVKGLDNAINGLGALFGGRGTLRSGLTFDEDTYEQAKPYFIEAVKNLKNAGNDIKDVMRAIVKMVLDRFGPDVTNNMKPYVVRFVNDYQEGKINVSNTDDNLESDSANTNAQDSGNEKTVSDERTADGTGTGSTSRGTEGTEDGAGGNSSSPINPAATGRKRSNKPVHSTEQPTISSELPPGVTDSERGGNDSNAGIQAGLKASDAIKALAQPGDKKATTSKVKTADAENIAATLPVLDSGQKSDVLFAEKRLAEHKGVMFTNGTGTGKTFTALGIVKRAVLQGKENIIIVVPSQAIANQWTKAASKFFDLNIKVLPDTRSAGKGVVITTYANFGENNALVGRDWDMVVHDESHKLMSNEAGDVTKSLEALRGITYHRDGFYPWFNRKNADIVKELKDSKFTYSDDMMDQMLDALRKRESDARDAYNKALEEAKVEYEKLSSEKDPKVVFLSATPFPYTKDVDYAEGYLFDYGTGENGSAYNSGDSRDRFFIQNFGFRMRYNKLTQPEAKVDTGVMAREFNSMLRKTGALSFRGLDVDYDYDRKFLLVDSAIGQRIDQALEWIREKQFRALSDKLEGQFDFLERRYLLEAIKANEVIKVAKDHMAKGRKVIIFHDYKKGGSTNPFIFFPEEGNTELNDQIAEFEQEFSDIINSFARLSSPIDALKKAFGNDVMIYNGSVSDKDRIDIQDQFNKDDSGKNLVLVQSASAKEGVSFHDTTGKHQRVLINIGLPTQPATAIQQEGRIYRVGQASDAMFRYMNTGTNWERWAFANTIAHRASNAENLAVGEGARALKDAFINAFQESDTYPAGHEGEGKGGKESDKSLIDSITEFDRAKTLYYGQGKRTSRNKSAEGTDYFATPEPVGYIMAKIADARPGESMLEPSAGHGAIARWFREDAKRTAIEPSGELSSRLALNFDSEVKRQTFEELNIINKYDAIVMNPPFGVGGKTAIEHLDKAFKHLRMNGRIVALIPEGPAADKRFNQWMYDNKDTEEAQLIANISLPTVTFERAGTKVKTRIVVVDKMAPEDAQSIQVQERDYSGETDINKLFDRIENISVNPRIIKEADIREKIEELFESIDTKHTKTKKDLFTVKPKKFLGDSYKDVSKIVKENNGYYSKFTKSFVFEKAEDRESFYEALGQSDFFNPNAAENTDSEIKFSVADDENSDNIPNYGIEINEEEIDNETYLAYFQTRRPGDQGRETDGGTTGARSGNEGQGKRPDKADNARPVEPTYGRFTEAEVFKLKGKQHKLFHYSNGIHSEASDKYLGNNTSTNAAWLGHYMTFEDWGGSDKYGYNRHTAYAKALKLYNLSIDQFDALSRKPLEQIKQVRKELIKRGYDAINLVGQEQIVVLEAKNVDIVSNPETELNDSTGFEDLDYKFSKSLDKDIRNLAIVHNLTANNLRNVLKLGGIPVPSLAVVNKDNPLSGFGEITLLGSKEQFAPNRENKFFDADIYSSRYPKITYEIDQKAFEGLQKDIAKAEAESGISATAYEERIADDGLAYLESNTALMYNFLKEKGIVVDPVMEKQEPLYQRYGAYVTKQGELKGSLKSYENSKLTLEELTRDNGFIKAAIDAKIAELEAKRAKGGLFKTKAERILNLINNAEEGNLLKSGIVLDAATAVKEINNPVGETDNVDAFKTSRAIRDAVENEEGFPEWVSQKYGNLIKNETIFNGYTPGGRRKYIPHTLANVVRLMKKSSVKNNEGSISTTARVRAALAKQFKKITDIQKDRGRLVTSEEMDGFAEAFTELHYKIESDIDNAIDGYSSPGRDFIAIAAEKGIAYAEREYETTLPDDIKTELARFFTELKNAPTEYFEAKINRAVTLSEFSGAVVPSGKEYDAVVESLKKAGIKEVRRYDNGDIKSRAEAINTFSDLFFSKNQPKPIKAPHSAGSLRSTLNKIFGRAWTDGLFATGKFKLISKDAAMKIVKGSQKAEPKYSKEGRIQGFFDPRTDTTYIVHDNLSRNMTKKDLEGLMMHEIGVHAMKLGRSDKVFRKIIDDFIALGKTNKAVQEAINRVPKGTKEAHRNEEALAYYVEKNPQMPLAKRLIAWLRVQLRKLSSTLPATQKASMIKWANSLTADDVVYMASKALRSAPTALMFDEVGSNDATIKRAREKGYEGDSKGEAEEWLRAIAKGLDMSKEARMQRARDMGFDVDKTYYHLTNKDLKELKPGGKQTDSFYKLKTFLSGSIAAQKAGIAGLTSGPAIWFADDPNKIQTGVGANKVGEYSNPNIMPVFLKKGKTFVVDAVRNKEKFDKIEEMVKPDKLSLPMPYRQKNFDGTSTMVRPDKVGFPERIDYTQRKRLLNSGYQSIEFTWSDDLRGEETTEFIVFDSNQVRSIHAAFDPDYKDSGNLLASKEQNDIDKAYFDALNKGDMEEVQRLVDDAAVQSGAPIFGVTDTTGFRVRRKKAPKKTVTVYKTFRMKDGKLYPMFVGAKDELPVGVWIDATEGGYHFTADNGREYIPADTGISVAIPNDDVRSELLRRGYIKSPTAKSIKVVAYRPGWHGGELPFFPQSGTKVVHKGKKLLKDVPDNYPYPNVHLENTVLAEVEMDADYNYEQEYKDTAERNKDGSINKTKSGLRFIPEGGYYEYATNPLFQDRPDLGKWYISGSVKINRILTQKEVNSKLDELEVPRQLWEKGDKLNLDKLGYDPQFNHTSYKLTDPVTYDNDGNIIPLSERFNLKKKDVRYSFAKRNQIYISDAQWRKEISNLYYNNDDKTRGIVVSMSPDEFLELASDSMGQAEERADEYGMFDAEKFTSDWLPTLDIDASGKVQDHEGRARAVMAERAGIKEIPVILRLPKADRISSVDKAPKTLTAQDSNKRIKVSSPRLVSYSEKNPFPESQYDGDGIKYSFAGEKSKVYNKEALAKAKAMEADGKTPREIWDETGFFKAPWDNKWRYEIDDASSIKMGVIDGTETSYRSLGNTISHKGWEKHYPDMKGMEAITKVDSESVEKGSYSPKEKGNDYYFGRDESIEVIADTEEKLRELLLHEGQHAIQHREGFAIGGNPFMFDEEQLAKEKSRLYNSIKQELIPQLVREYRAETDPEIKKQIAQAKKELDKYAIAISKMSEADMRMEKYKMLAGEAEARLVQKRMDMTPEQRRAYFPLDHLRDMLREEGLAPGINFDALGVIMAPTGQDNASDIMFSVADDNTPDLESERRNRKYEGITDAVKSAWRNLSKAKRKAQLAVLSLRQITEIGNDLFKGIPREVQRAKDKLDAKEQSIIHKASLIYERGKNLPKAERDSLADIAHLATFSQVSADPEVEFEETGKNDKERFRITSQLRKRFKEELSDEGRKLYRDMRDFYKERDEERNNAIKDRIEEDARAGLLSKSITEKFIITFEVENRLSGDYFPLTRFGDFWLHYKDSSGEPVFMTFDTKEDARDEIARLNLQEGGYSLGMNGERIPAMEGVDPRFIDSVNKIIDGVSQSEEATQLKDAIYQKFLETLPALSSRKSYIHRKNRLGYQDDIFRAFAHKSVREARQNARLIHGKTIRSLISDMEKAAKMSESIDKMKEAELTQQAIMELEEFEWTVEDIDRMKDYAEGDTLRKYQIMRKYAVMKENAYDFLDIASILKTINKQIAIAKHIKSGEDGDFEHAENIVQELKDFYANIMNSNVHPITQLVNSIGFSWFLGASPAAAFMNSMQVPSVSIPYMSAEFGMGRTTKAFKQAYLEFIKGERNAYGEISIEKSLKNSDEKAAFKEFFDLGLLSRTLTHDMMGAGDRGVEEYTGFRGVMNSVMGHMFQFAERSNREVTAMAAFRLKRDMLKENQHKNKLSDRQITRQAIDYAIEATYATHGDYNSTNRPRAFRGDVARVITQFKQYPQMITFLYYNTMLKAFNSYADEPSNRPEWVNAILPKQKRLSKGEIDMAKAQLRNMLIAQFAFAGTAGMPLGIFGLSALSAVLEMGLDDDDEPFDLDAYLRKQSTEFIGETPTKFLVRGLGGALTLFQGDLHSRMSQSDLWIRDDDPDAEGKDAHLKYLKYMAGPVFGGVLGNILAGHEMMKEPHDWSTWRGLEKMAPKFIGDPMKGIRYAADDAKTLKGDLVEEIDAFEALIKALGLQPFDLADRYAQSNTLMTLQRRLSDRRTYLRQKAAIAKIEGNTEELRRIWEEEIKEGFNAKWEGSRNVPITMQDINATVKALKSSHKNTDHGIRLNDKYQTLIDKYRYLQ